MVILADQLAAVPADSGHLSQRAASAHADQNAVLARLTGPAPADVKHFTVGNALSATVTVAQAAALAADPAVASVTQDKLIRITPTNATTGTAVAPSGPSPRRSAAAAVPSAPAAVCSTNPAKPMLEPEALQSMNVRSDDPTARTAAALGIDGAGVKVAYIADGLDPNNAGFLRKNGTSAVVDYKDFYGDGLHSPGGGAEAYGDVSAVVAQGNAVYDLATFGNPAVISYPGGHCYARIVGVAPGASMVALKAGADLLPNSAILQAIDYAVTVAHVDVLNESFGGDSIPDAGSRNAIQTFDEQAVAAGVTVTVSSGDAGVTNTIGSPATSSKVISAGATTDSRAYLQSNYALAATFGNGTWRSSNISALSSAGVSQYGRTIDVSAPGEADWAVCDDSGNWSQCTNYAGGLSPFELFGGTSQAAPLTAGVAALVIQAYRKAHGGASPTPDLVKKLITSTARDLGFPGEDQGAGIIDARAAVEAALTYPGGQPAASANNTVPSNTVPSNTVPSNTVPSNTVPSNTVPSNTVPSNTVPSNTVPSNTVPSNTVPSNNAAPNTNRVPTKNTVPKSTASNNAVPTNNTPSNNTASIKSLSSNIVLSTDQLTLTGAPGTTRRGSVTVHNVGTTALTVIPATRRYLTVSSDDTTIRLSPNGPTTPYPTTAAPWSYKEATFIVPPGTDVLNASMYWHSGALPGGTGPAVRFSLFNPSGGFETNTRPQGGPNPANYGSTLVRHPAAGTWRAVFYTNAATGFFGPVTFNSTSERAIPVGTVSPSLFTLAPGAFRVVSVSLPTGTIGGDTVDTLSLGSSGGHQVAVPVILRALVPTSTGSGQFAGTITGGNARSPFPGQQFSYAFDVPRGKRDLDVAVQLHSAGDVLFGALIDPNGEVQSGESTLTPANDGTRGALSNVVADPQAGRWHYVVGLVNPVTGTELSQTFQGVVTFDRIAVRAAGLPTGGKLTAGTRHAVSITITNPLPTPIYLQTDARLGSEHQVQLAPQFAGSTIDLPLSVNDLSNLPQYLVPPDTSRLAVTAASTVPAQIELNSPNGGIDTFGDLTSAQNGSTVSTARVSERSPFQLGTGFWATYVQEIGPFGDAGAAAGSSTLTAVATTKDFDRAVTSSTGDPYLASVDLSAGTGTALVIAPGASKALTVTLDPTAPRGTRVDGVLHLLSAANVGGVVSALFNESGDIYASIPYCYTVS